MRVHLHTVFYTYILALNKRLDPESLVYCMHSQLVRGRTVCVSVCVPEKTGKQFSLALQWAAFGRVVREQER